VKPLVTMREALADPDLFGSILDGESWTAWRVLLVAVMGEPLMDDERAVFVSLTGRENGPPSRVDEAWLIMGRRSGKTRSAAVLASYIAGLCDHADKLAPGERGVLPIMSASTWQATKAFGFVSGIFAEVPALKGLVEKETSDTLSLSSRVDIECRPASFRTVRGSTFVAAIADEVAFWRSDETSRNPDSEILAAARPALATTGGPLIAMSSPYAKAGEIYAAFKRDYGPDGDELILVAKAASRTMNSTLSQRVVDRAYERDAAPARAEYDAEFRDDVSGFVDAETVGSAIEAGVSVRAMLAGMGYVAFTDPSGGSSDSFTLAIAHAEGERVILDFIGERKAPFSPASVVAEFAAALKEYRISTVRGDRYAGEWPREAFQAHGITYQPADLNRSELYLATLPLLNSGRVSLLDNQRMAAQFVGLERRTSRAGKDSVDHGPGGHDDIANAVAGALVLACGRAESGFITFYRTLSEERQQGQQPKAEAMVRLRAPASVGHVQVLSGRTVCVPENRILELDENDAKPLIGAGFMKIEREVA
jgi:hypothetical protein